ncbi:MAG TPA: DUF3280 domain-containing protein [Hyphomicrobiaceae bacterium]|nr:DUF3280 domain-containing protein [Hyphomicrobiaceae bacterium]
MKRLACILLGALLTGATAAYAGPKVAVFPFELIDASLEGQYGPAHAEEAARLRLATEELRKELAGKAGYEVLDLGPMAAEIERSTPLYKCDGCALDLARRSGAELAVTGSVLKVSNLLLTFHIYVTDTSNGKLNKLWHVEVRGNTEDSWLRGVRRLVRDGIVGG